MNDERDPQLLETDEAVVAAWRAAESESLPTSLRHRMERDAEEQSGSDDQPTLKLPLIVWSGWLAAAAATMLAVGLWIGQPSPTDSTPTMAELQQRPGAAVVTLTSPTDDADGSAQVAFDPAEQVGVVSLTDLPPLLEGEVYQLWIIDADRDAEGGRNRVDGGTFVAGRGVVAFEPRLPIGSVAGFAVTREPAGGSVVSLLGDRLLLIGTVDAAG
jgi:hypothetical protein